MTSSRPLRLLIGLAALALLTSACAGGEDVAEDTATPSPDQTAEQPDAGQPDILEGELHACAENLPVPDGLSVLQSGLVPTGEGSEVCIASMQGDETVDAVTASYRSTLDDAGWAHETEQEDESANVLRMTEPECGFLIVATAQAAGEFGLVSPEQAQQEGTMAVAQLLDCEEMPPPQQQEDE